ncbi:MAG: hypothetical protein E6Q97_01125 [Desulfurellales bacterium]|nr:MAG: hypothetical protein E6Q97_01125 [Desulfurellales bacterium]
MKYIGTAFAASIVLIVAWTMYTIEPIIPDMARGAANNTTAIVNGAAEMTALAVRACIGTAVLVVAALLLWLFLRQRHEANRQRDGAFPLREYHIEPWTKRLFNLLQGKPSPRVILDINAAMSHAAVIYQGVHLAEPPAGWDRQLAYMGDIERTRRVQAAIAGDAVLGNPLVNLQRGIGGVANAATGRMLAGAYDKPTRTPTFVDANPPAPQLPAPELDGMTAVEQSRPASIVMGQTDAGDLVRWNMAQTPHLRFHGMTQGSGKTNAIQTVAAGALATGAHVVICDRVQFKDWGDFDGRAEFVDTSSPQQLADACARLYNIYLGRTHMLRQKGAKNIAQHGGMQRIVVIVSEFGAQMADARADGIGREVEYPLTQLARLAGSAGIHLVAEDQAVQSWPRPLIANMSPVIGKMPDHAGQACGYHGRGGGTGAFPSYTFWYEGVMLHTPHMEPALPSIMDDVPPPQALVMLTPKAAIPGEDMGDRSAFGRSVKQEQGGDAPVFTPEYTERTTERTGNTPVANVLEEGPTDLQSLVWQWRDEHPDGAQADMRREFAARGIEIARGYAHELWHKWTPTQEV